MVNDLVLVLNSGMVPIAVCTVRDAVLAIFRDIAIPVLASEAVLRSPSTNIAVPRIISHYRYHRIPRAKPTINKRNIILRDNHSCVYCKKKFPVDELTIDHVIPRSRWRKLMGERPRFDFHSWENMVSACRRCNSIKGNRLLKEIGWKLERAPREPERAAAIIISRQRAEKLGWIEYCNYNVHLVG